MENFEKYYRSYKYMKKLLQTDFTHNYLRQNLEDNDKGADILSGKINQKVIDMEWVTAIEDTLPYIEKAIEEQRRFIKETQEVYRIDKAKIINKDSVKHLSQHTNFIAKIEGDKVTPNKVLTVEREESFEIYENRFLITLVRLALQFVGDKYRKMVDAPTDTYNKIEMKRDLVLNDQHVTFNIEYSNEIKDDKADDLNVEDYEKLSDFDRVRRIREKLNQFLNTPLMKEIANCVPVRPPILHTNLMTKNPNYKASLDLYNYLNAYKKPGYEVVGKEFEGKMDKDVQQSVYMSLGFQHFMMSLATNTALKNLLEERYQEENEMWDKEGKLPIEEQRRRELDRIEKVRQEEMKIRLTEIREREKIIREQKSEIASLKREIEKRDKTIESLKSSIKALEDELRETQEQLQKAKAELVKAYERIAELETQVAILEAKVEELEAKIVELEAKVAELEKVKAELEAKIVELEQIIEEQKAKIAELEEIVAQQKLRIKELESAVAELEKIKAELENNIVLLEKENAAKQATIEAHEATIADQKSKIAALDDIIAGLKTDIEGLNGTIAQQNEQLLVGQETIDNLNHRLENLNKTYEDECSAHKTDIENLTVQHEDTVDKLKLSHQAELESKDAAHTKKIESINKEHRTELDNLVKRYDSEKKQIQKTADQRVKAAQKDADKKAADKIKAEIAKAQKEAKKAAKKATETAAKLKADYKSERGIRGLFGFDCRAGSMGMQAMMAIMRTSQGVDAQTVLNELSDNSKISCVYVVRDKKGITIAQGGLDSLKVVKAYKGSTDFDLCRKHISDILSKADKSAAYITYKTMDKLFINELEASMSEEYGFENTRVYHNKAQKPGASSFGIYYYKG